MDIKSLGNRIRQLREDKEMGLREFARKIAISAAFLSDIEQGRRYPSNNVLKEIAVGLGISISEIESHDSRVPIEEFKRMAQADPVYGFALRTVAGNPEELLKLAKKLERKKNNKDEND